MYARVMYGNKNMPMNYSCFICDNADDLQSLPTTKQKSSGNKYPVCCAGSLAYVWEENKTYILNNADVWSFYFDGYRDFDDCCIDDCNDVIAGGAGDGDSGDAGNGEGSNVVFHINATSNGSDYDLEFEEENVYDTLVSLFEKNRMCAFVVNHIASDAKIYLQSSCSYLDDRDDVLTYCFSTWTNGSSGNFAGTIFAILIIGEYNNHYSTKKLLYNGTQEYIYF